MLCVVYTFIWSLFGATVSEEKSDAKDEDRLGEGGESGNTTADYSSYDEES